MSDTHNKVIAALCSYEIIFFLSYASGMMMYRGHLSILVSVCCHLGQSL